LIVQLRFYVQANSSKAVLLLLLHRFCVVGLFIFLVADWSL